MIPNHYDVAVIGGGFYGISIALLLKKYYPKVIILEKEKDVLLRASAINQARVHGGYHYPRSFLTAVRSARNFQRFITDYRECIYDHGEAVYAIAKTGSKIGKCYFEKLAKNIHVELKPAPKNIKKLFNDQLIEEVYTVEEKVFDVDKLRTILKDHIKKNGIEVRFQTEVTSIHQKEHQGIELDILKGEHLFSKKVYNCTYAGINHILQESQLKKIDMKHELVEMALIRVPKQLEDMSITVMDGPFFSIMPFPIKKLHSLSHVRYTPHCTWEGVVPNRSSSNVYSGTHSRYMNMVKDAQKFIPVLKNAEYVESIYEIKTLLKKNEIDDGRPILFLEHETTKDFYTIMGAKIDNIYDILKIIEDKEQVKASNVF